jgi:hypothetical protein
VRPEVRPIPENGLIIAKDGDSVTLRCEVRHMRIRDENCPIPPRGGGITKARHDPN